MTRVIIPEEKPREMSPITVKGAAKGFTEERHVVGYQSGCSTALLVRTGGKGSMCRYGFIYLSSPNREPAFDSSSAYESIRKAASFKSAKPRHLYTCGTVMELIEACSKHAGSRILEAPNR